MSDTEFWDWFNAGVQRDGLQIHFALTHDGGYDEMTDEERQEWEDRGDHA
jgi:hypothetical protein